MAMQWTTNAQKVAPAGATAVSVTPNNTAMANSAWFEVLASAPAALVLTGLCIPVAPVSAFVYVDVGIGAASAETVITTFMGHYTNPGSSKGASYIPHVLPLDAIPNGSRVAIRMRKHVTGVTPWQYAITYLEKPIVGNLQTTTQPQLVQWTSAAITAPASAWTNSAWSVLLASAAADLVVTHVAANTFTSGAQWEMDLGVGPAASETVIATLRGQRGGGFDGPNVIPLWNPLDAIPSGSRVVARLRASATGTCFVGVQYHQKPL